MFIFPFCLYVQVHLTNVFFNVVLLCCGLCGFYEVDPTLKKLLGAFGCGSGGDGREEVECEEDILQVKVGSMKAKTLCVCVYFKWMHVHI